MVRRLMTPRWLGIHLLAVVLVAAFVWLGHWQLDRAADFRQSAGTSAEPAPTRLQSLTQPSGSLPAAAIGRLVTVSGSYDRAHTYLVPGHVLGSRQGFWILAVVRVPAGQGVLVVRGWVRSATTAVATPAGAVEITGRLAASDDPSGGLPAGTTLPAGQVAAANPVDLLTSVPYPLYDGYVILRTQLPMPPTGLALVPSPKVGNDVPGFYFQHVAYVALWWLFAAFVVFFWWRLVRDEGRPPRGPAGSDS